MFDNGPYQAQTQHDFPAILTLEDARHLVTDSPTSAPLLGVDGEGNPVSVDLDSDSPHVLVNAPSGGGKSVILRSLTAQVVANGGLAVVLDLKRISHRWAKGLEPNIQYAKTLPQIGNALIDLGKEVHRRNKIVEEWDGPVETAPVGPRLVIVFEELNSTLSEIADADKRRKRAGATEYLALDALKDIMFMGRAAKVHVIAVAQYATAEAMGGGAIRENFGVRILAGEYTAQAWKMLTNVWPAVPAPREVGRGRVCKGASHTETQLLYVSEEEAAELAMSTTAAQEVRAALTRRGGWSSFREMSQAVSGASWLERHTSKVEATRDALKSRLAERKAERKAV